MPIFPDSSKSTCQKLKQNKPTYIQELTKKNKSLSEIFLFFEWLHRYADLWK